MPSLRPATNTDQQAIIELITNVYREYGETMCLENADKDLLDIEANYAQKGGAFVVLENSGDEKLNGNKHNRIIAAHATLPIDSEKGLVTFRRLYSTTEVRGTGVGVTMMGWALNWAIENKFTDVQFWSDTRFERAHTFFAKFGLAKGHTRDMNDGYEPYSEYRFTMTLPSQPIDWSKHIADLP